MTHPQQSDWPDPAQPAPAFGHPSEPTTAPAHPYPGTYPPPGYAPYPVIVSPPTNGMAIAALVCAVLGLGPIAAILGHVARRQIRETGEQGDGFALAGIIVGWVTTGIVACVCIGYIAFFATMIGTFGTVGT
jgi:hypothetical protein